MAQNRLWLAKLPSKHAYPVSLFSTESKFLSSVCSAMYNHVSALHRWIYPGYSALETIESVLRDIRSGMTDLNSMIEVSDK